MRFIGSRRTVTSILNWNDHKDNIECGTSLLIIETDDMHTHTSRIGIRVFVIGREKEQHYMRHSSRCEHTVGSEGCIVTD
jgi:hypothetical protein